MGDRYNSEEPQIGCIGALRDRGLDRTATGDTSHCILKAASHTMYRSENRT
jgi:hypothetical protein